MTDNPAAGRLCVQRQGLEVFLDLNYHDMPNTVAGADYLVVGWGGR